jgi:hypothetical protein
MSPVPRARLLENLDPQRATRHSQGGEIVAPMSSAT